MDKNLDRFHRRKSSATSSIVVERVPMEKDSKMSPWTKLCLILLLVGTAAIACFWAFASNSENPRSMEPNQEVLVHSETLDQRIRNDLQVSTQDEIDLLSLDLGNQRLLEIRVKQFNQSYVDSLADNLQSKLDDSSSLLAANNVTMARLYANDLIHLFCNPHYDNTSFICGQIWPEDGCPSQYAVGADCTICFPGYYGSSCSLCPSCLNGGYCDEGYSGLGGCVCPPSYEGNVCQQMTPAPTPAPTPSPTPAPTPAPTLDPRLSAPIRAFSSCGSEPLKVVLTFDDGPHTISTPILLDELDELQIPATFYMAAEGMEWVSPERCQLISHVLNDRAMPHTAHMHSYHHTDHSNFTRSQMIEELNLSLDWMTGCGANPTQYRPPFGILPEEYAALLTSRGFEVAMWNIESDDFLQPSTLDVVYDRIINDFETYVQVPNSAVILLHDHPYQDHPGLVRRLAEYFVPRGYEFITADQCLSYCTEARCRGVHGPSPYRGVFIP
jgi:peptidoglycan/xylan/chitin deacetylase (PgdA/CDA1 family)